MKEDAWGLAWIYLYLFGVLALGEAVRRFKAWPSEFTRKCVHIGVGFWGFIAMASVQSRWMALIPPLSFVGVNLLSYRWNLIPAIEIPDKRNLGTVYYPLSLCVLVVLFWKDGFREAALVGSMVMGLGDGFASIVGRRWGRRVYRIWKHPKTLEGSAAMAVFSFVGAAAVLAAYSGLPPGAVAGRALALAASAALIEGASPWGLDNLTVPLGSGLLYAWWFL